MTLFEFTITTDNLKEFLLNLSFVISLASFFGTSLAMVLYSWVKCDD